MKKFIVTLFMMAVISMLIRDLSYIIILNSYLNQDIEIQEASEITKQEEQIISEKIQEKQKVDNTVIEEKETVNYRNDIPLDKTIQETIIVECEKYNIPIELVYGLIKHESSFNTKAKNSIGCYGLMQLNPKYFPSNLNSIDNVKYGIEYLNTCIVKYKNNIPAALRAYNAGHDDGKREYSNTVINYARNFGYSG